MLTQQDRRNIRTGAMRATGQRHASLIFWTSVAPYLLGALLALAVLVGGGLLLHAWWVGTLGPWLQGDNGPINLALVIAAAVVVVLGVRWLFRPRGGAPRRGQR